MVRFLGGFSKKSKSNLYSHRSEGVGRGAVIVFSSVPMVVGAGKTREGLREKQIGVSSHFRYRVHFPSDRLLLVMSLGADLYDECGPPRRC